MSINLTNKQLCKIRTITTFIILKPQKSSWADEIQKAATVCLTLLNRFKAKGYEVQSIRMVTNPFGEYLNTQTLNSARQDMQSLNEQLASINSSTRIRFAIGEATTEAEIKLLPDLIKEFGDLCNICVNVGQDENGFLNNELIEQSAKAVRKISQITPRGEGNFNFTVNFNCEPLIPYFPASYHRTALGRKIVVGLETPDLLLAVLKNVNETTQGLKHRAKYARYLEAMSIALQNHIDAIKQTIDNTIIDADFSFAGFDSSAAPSKECSSMTALYEAMGVEHFGAAGTVEVSSLLTKVFKSIKHTELVGFSGLMLALTEDTGLAQGTINDQFDIRALLTYSAVCGIGLDTVPIPGDTPIEKISAIMRDTGTMAYRLNKPLTVRVFPVPHLKAGDMTAFESDDLCNCKVLVVP